MLILPNGISHEGALYNKLIVEELTGKQQNYLVNTKYKSPIDHIERILTDLVVDIRDSNENSLFTKMSKKDVILNKLAHQDLQFIIIKIRELSFGERYFLPKAECSHCKHVQKQSQLITLNTLEVFKPESKPDTFTTPKGAVIKYRPLNLINLVKSATQAEEIMDNMMTSVVSYVVESVNGTPSTPSTFESMSAKELTSIQENVPAYSHIDTTVEMTCESCKKDFSVDLDVFNPSFFVHTKI